MPTTIQIRDTTLKRLKEHKITQRQTYDEIINNALDEIEEETLTQEEIEDIQEGLEQIKQGKTHTIEEVAKQLGIQL